VKWTELYRLAAEAHCDLLAIDASLSALAESRNVSLHAWVNAELPTPSALCAALDGYGVPVSDEVEAQVVLRLGFVMFGVSAGNNQQTSQLQPTMGSAQPALA